MIPHLFNRRNKHNRQKTNWVSRKHSRKRRTPKQVILPALSHTSACLTVYIRAFYNEDDLLFRYWKTKPGNGDISVEPNRGWLKVKTKLALRAALLGPRSVLAACVVYVCVRVCIWSLQKEFQWWNIARRRYWPYFFVLNSILISSSTYEI